MISDDKDVEVSWSNSLNRVHPVEQILNRNQPWLTSTSYIGHAFTIKVGRCSVYLAGIRIKNTVNGEMKNRATRKFRVIGNQDSSSRSPWVTLLSEEFENPLLEGAPAPELQTFYFTEVIQVKYLTFQLESFWGNLGGGLDHFEVISPSGTFLVIVQDQATYNYIHI